MPTHGALTKAGRVRNITPKVDKTAPNRKRTPRERNKQNYKKRILDARPKRFQRR